MVSMEEYGIETFLGQKLSEWGEPSYTLRTGNEVLNFNFTQPPRVENGNYVTGYNCSYPYIFDFERDFPSAYYVNLTGTYRWLAKWFMLTYLLGIYLLKNYMSTRTKYDLRVSLVLWNFGLALISTLGGLRSLQELYQIVGNQGFMFSICYAGKP